MRTGKTTKVKIPTDDDYRWYDWFDHVFDWWLIGAFWAGRAFLELSWPMELVYMFVLSYLMLTRANEMYEYIKSTLT